MHQCFAHAVQRSTDEDWQDRRKHQHLQEPPLAALLPDEGMLVVRAIELHGRGRVGVGRGGSSAMWCSHRFTNCCTSHCCTEAGGRRGVFTSDTGTVQLTPCPTTGALCQFTRWVKTI